MSIDTAAPEQATEHRYVAYARRTLAQLGAERITQMDAGDLFSWCSRLETSLRRLMIIIDGQQVTTAPTVRDALVELAELAIDNPELDVEIFDSAIELTPLFNAPEGRVFWWDELKATREQYNLGDLTADGPDHWETRVEEALDKLLGVRR